MDDYIESDVVVRLEADGDDKVLSFKQVDGQLLLEVAMSRSEMYQMVQGLYNALKADVAYSYVVECSDEVMN